MNRQELEEAFRATTYRVQAGDGWLGLRTGVMQPDFSRWLRQQGVSCWGIVTACNPVGNFMPNENAARTETLRKKIAGNGWRYLPACNRADTGDWPDEPGFCVLDVEIPALCALAAEFGQAAIVCGMSDGAGRLVWLSNFQAPSP